MTGRTPEQVLRDYFHAKDENRPHLMRQVFCEEALLRMEVKSEAIAFPAVTRGLPAISEVLVSRFAQDRKSVV